jgi:hypothetical protein
VSLTLKCWVLATRDGCTLVCRPGTSGAYPNGWFPRTVAEGFEVVAGHYGDIVFARTKKEAVKLAQEWNEWIAASKDPETGAALLVKPARMAVTLYGVGGKKGDGK